MRLAALLIGVLLSLAATAQEKWVTSWAASVQGPYPVGNPSAQPKLDVVFPTPQQGARDQSFRLVVRPAIWGREARIRLSNAFGTKPVTFKSVHVGLQHSGPALVQGTNQPVRFSGRNDVTVAPGAAAWSDAVALPFVRDAADPLLQGRKLAVSFHVAGESGPMTWHAKALQTSYVSAPGGGAHADEDGEALFPYSTASWYFLDALDIRAPAATRLVVAFGDSITDGTASTMNGDDRWPDVLARRLYVQYGNRVAVVNAGIGGNQIAGPAEYSAAQPFAGGPASGQRLERDIISLSGVSAVIWLEGINDFSKNGNASVDTVTSALREGVARLRTGVPGVRVIGATLVTALGSTNAAHGSPEQDEKRKALNAFIRSSGLFDSVIDFDAVVLDAATGAMRAEFVPESTTGGAGDKLHPNRAGYLAMGMAIDLKALPAPELRP
jgi:lysophospholipase L1-like esterase